MTIPLINVLDYGYVKYVNSMGNETSIIEAARMSTSGSFVSWEPYDHHPKGDVGLLDYLYRNKHMSPFEMCELIVDVQLPIFVAREWMRHRTFSFNEFSARYSVMSNIHYTPSVDRLKQVGATKAESIKKEMMDEQHNTFSFYEAWLEEGVPKELARINNPVSSYTKMRVKANLRNWLQFLDLRLRNNAQYEIRVYAEAISDIIKNLWPKTYELFQRYTLNGVSIPKAEYDRLKDIEFRIKSLEK